MLFFVVEKGFLLSLGNSNKLESIWTKTKVFSKIEVEDFLNDPIFAFFAKLKFSGLFFVVFHF